MGLGRAELQRLLQEEQRARVGLARDDAAQELGLERDHGAVLVGDSFSPVTFGSAALLWYPLHGKLRVGGSIVHFDVHLDLGVGVVDASTSRGAMGLVGGGLEFYAGSASAIRIDIRDHLYRQELLDTSFLVSDMTFTVGYSIFLPLEL